MCAAVRPTSEAGAATRTRSHRLSPKQPENVAAQPVFSVTAGHCDAQTWMRMLLLLCRWPLSLNPLDTIDLHWRENKRGPRTSGDQKGDQFATPFVLLTRSSQTTILYIAYMISLM